MYREIVGIFVVIVVVTAVPVWEDDSEKALLQGVLDQIDDWSEPLASPKPPVNGGSNVGLKSGGHTHKPRRRNRLRNVAAKPIPVNSFNKDEEDIEDEAEVKNYDMTGYLPRDGIILTRKNDMVRDEGINSDDEENDDNLEIPDGDNQNEVKIERFKSLLGKFLRVLNHKLKPRNRTPEEDRQAVYKPTKWKDLGRNILRTIVRRLDPSNKESDVEKQESEEAKIEKIKAIKLFFKKALKAVKKVFKFLKPKGKSRMYRPSWYDRDESRDETDTRHGGYSSAATDDEAELQDAAAEIENTQSYLTSALDSINGPHLRLLTFTAPNEEVIEEAHPAYEIAQEESLWRLAKKFLRLIKGRKRRRG